MLHSPSRLPAAPSPLPEWAETGLLALEARHADLARIRPAAGPLPWRQRDPGFPGLLRAICGQMISNQAAGAIWGRFSALPGALTPEGLLLLDEAALRGVGLSRPKVGHVRALAAACASRALDLDAVALLPDVEAVTAIAAIPGLGPWSASVHLLFGLQRPDVFPPGDVALAAALASLRNLDIRPTHKALVALAEDWKPYRSLAARLLWHHWRHVTGRAAGEG
ncbi:MAG TPA: DNA-3-methyladenine glycosylase 2 family protein [Roseomonas sp.]|jgi:DNA-3-methyladenine glycosylase II